MAKLAAGMAHGAAVAGTAGDLPLLVSDGLGKKASLLDLARKEVCGSSTSRQRLQSSEAIALVSLFHPPQQ